MTKLSVIIPCYNCADTLGEAVASLFRQDPVIPFDLTMVDDGSTDSTYAVMEELRRDQPRINLVRHESNLGGGAARNTGVARSAGDLLFFLDSDDILGPDFLRNMTQFWLKKKCDAVGMSTSVKFRGRNLNDVAYVTEFEGPGKPVRFESFFEGPRCSLSVVFMMTRRAFEAVGGYPTEHGFDTQGMAWRFLCGGMTAYTCPDTVYFHRVEFHDSYYLREYARGAVNWNWFCILEEHLYLLNDRTKDRLLTADLFAAPGKPAPPPVVNIMREDRNVYTRGYRTLLRLGRAGAARRLVKSKSGFAQYWLGTYWYSKGSYERAIDHFRNALRAGFRYRIVYYRMLQASLKLSGREVPGPDGLRALLGYSQPYPEDRLPLRHRIVLYLLRNRFTRAPASMLNTGWLRLREALQPRRI
jgi:glycosyltransferase involved in cell wall biosynthesis